MSTVYYELYKANTTQKLSTKRVSKSTPAIGRNTKDDRKDRKDVKETERR